MTYGVSYSEFRSDSAKWFSKRDHRKIWKTLAKVSLGCSLIIAYADDVEPILIRIESDGLPHWEECYSCIGAGADIAMAYLCQKDYDEQMPLMDCLAQVYVTKRMAQKNPYVGNESSFDILVHGDAKNEKRTLTDDGWKYLRDKMDAERTSAPLEFDEAFLGQER
jgi:20S proteasome alpha/beta subunit